MGGFKVGDIVETKKKPSRFGTIVKAKGYLKWQVTFDVKGKQSNETFTSHQLKKVTKEAAQARINAQAAKKKPNEKETTNQTSKNRNAHLALSKRFSWDSSSSSDNSEKKNAHPGKGRPKSNDNSSYSSSKEQQVRIRQKCKQRKRQEEVLADDDSCLSSVSSDSVVQTFKTIYGEETGGTSVHSSCHDFDSEGGSLLSLDEVDVDWADEEDIVEDAGKVVDIHELEPLDEHRRKWLTYEVEKNKMLEKKWSVTKTSSDSQKVKVGTIVVTRKLPPRQGEVFEKVGKKWKVAFNEDEVELLAPQSLKVADEAGINENEAYEWTIVQGFHPEESLEEYTELGLIGFDFAQFAKECLSLKNTHYGFPFLKLLQKLCPGDWRMQLKQMNSRIQLDNERKKRDGKRTMKEVSEREWWTFLGIIIAAAPVGKGGERLWETRGSRDECTFSTPINLGPKGLEIMPKYRFDTIKKVFPSAFHDHEARRKGDDWYPIGLLVKGFNENRRNTVAASKKKVLDEIMSAFRPRTTATGALPNISYILRKPEPLGSELKSELTHPLPQCFQGAFLVVEPQEGKERMRKKRYAQRHGCTAACVLRLADASEYSGQNCIERKEAREERVREQFDGDSWFASVAVADQMSERRREFVGPVKTNHKYCPTEEIQGVMRHWPSGSQLFLECTTPLGNTIYATGYKYNSRKVLVFVSTRNAGSSEPGDPYIAKFPDEHGNVCERQVPRPQLVAQFFHDSNVIDSHNHARQFELALEKHWVTQDVWFRLNTTFIGLTVTDAWKLFKYGVGEMTQKEMPLVDFADRAAFDCIYNELNDRAGYSNIAEDAHTPPVPLVSTAVVTSSFHAGEPAVSPLSNATSSSQTALTAISEHLLIENPEFEAGLSQRRKRRTCRHAGCKQKTSMMCSNEVCRRVQTKSSNDNISFGSFFCRNHFHEHVLDMARK